MRGYKLPQLRRCCINPNEQAVVREEALRDEAKTLVEKCAEFGVDGTVTQINPGPVVTTFEFRPDAGVKYAAALPAWPTTSAWRWRPSPS